MAVTIQSMKFWLNAFIPQHIPGYTKAVPGSPGSTMIPGPQRATIYPEGTPFIGKTSIEISDCYHTDQRSFSNDINAKSRMHSEVKVNLLNLPPTISQWHKCYPTTECDCEDGDIECHEEGSITRMKFTLRPVTIPMMPSPGLIPGFPGSTIIAGKPRAEKAIIDMKCIASNPCAPSSRLFGDIDAVGTITIDTNARSIELDGMIDQFPAFEAYATINDGAGVTLFQIPPPVGNTVMNLPGGPNRRVWRKLVDSNGDGVFEKLIKMDGLSD